MRPKCLTNSECFSWKNEAFPGKSASQVRELRGPQTPSLQLRPPPASYRTSELEFPKTAGETARETRSAGGTAGGTAAVTSRLSAPQRKGSPAGSFRSSSPSTQSFPGSFPSSLRSSFGEFQLGGRVVGRGSRNTTVRTAKITNQTFTIPAINQVINYQLWPSLKNSLGNFWLAECLQYKRMQNYRHPVYRPKVVLGITLSR